MADEPRFSFPYGVALLLYPVLAVLMAMGHGKWWGYGVILAAAALAFAFAREGFSRESFGKIKDQDPSLTLLTWRINWLGIFALPPALLAVYGLVKMILR